MSAQAAQGGLVGRMRARRARKAARVVEPQGRRIEVTPPEGVPISYAVAGMGARFGAQLLDLIVSLLIAGAPVLLLSATDALAAEGLITLFLLLMFFARSPYYIVSELIWNGATLGKKAVGIRVIGTDGRRIEPWRIVVRNLMKEVEVFLPVTALFGATLLVPSWAMWVWMLGVLSVPFWNRRRQRLGDMLAGVAVVEAPRPALLPDLAATAPAPASGAVAREAAPLFAFAPHHLDVYGRYELQRLEDILRRGAPTKAEQNAVAKVATTIIAKIGYTEKVAPALHRKFLEEFYRAQRGYLEHRNLFGDAREDKTHGAAKRQG